MSYTNYDISPDGTLAAIGTADGSIYAVSIPSGPSPLALPRQEFQRRIGARTNLRAVSDPAAENGYRFVTE